MIEGRTVALVGSGPGSAENPPGFVDSHEVVIRVNNYKCEPNSGTGQRTDIFYSYFGSAVNKSAQELKDDGVKLCWAKCPNDQFIESPWHRARGKMNGVDFRYIYRNREDWWFCDTVVPTTAEFLEHFNLLDGHVPTTGFSAILDVLKCNPRNLFLTGFDFFQSGVHNLNERWKSGDPTDPIGHVPDKEREWFAKNAPSLPVTMDDLLSQALVNNVKQRMTPLSAMSRRERLRARIKAKIDARNRTPRMRK